MNVKRIGGHILYAETINSDRYLRLILTELFVLLTEEERSCMWFQQDSATAQTADDPLLDLEGLFCDRISCGLWPHLTTYDFYLWVNMKDKSTERNPYRKKS
jgi:hypothetical protein